MNAEELSFEHVRSELARLSVPAGQARSMMWLRPQLGIGKNADGNYEVFIRGPQVTASSPMVSRQMQYGHWQSRQGEEPFAATLLALPAAPHFVALAALIGIELVRCGISLTADPQPAFRDVEPIIELAIRRGALAEHVIVGLIGELITLRQSLLSIVGEPTRRASVLNSWQGWRDGLRDFTFGSNSIEVKTTRLATSMHEFSGLHQVERQRLPDGSDEKLYVLSIGLTPSQHAGETLPSIVDQLLLMFASEGPRDEALQVALLEHVASYGGRGGGGYRHLEMREWPAYSVRYSHSFAPRLYDMSDPEMLVLRRRDIERTFVDAASLRFSMHLPERISALNPSDSWSGDLANIINAER
jgi:hypothetical protein